MSKLFIKISQDEKHSNPILISVKDIQKECLVFGAIRVIDSTTAEESVIDFLKDKYNCQNHKEFPILNDVNLNYNVSRLICKQHY